MSQVAALDAQGIFNTVVLHLAQQGGPAIDLNGHCAYRTNNGRKCAAGVLLSDDDYKPEMENRTACTAEVGPFLPTGHLSLIRRLQMAHDNAARDTNDPDARWLNVHGQNGIARSLRNIAGEYGLSSAKVREAFSETVAA